MRLMRYAEGERGEDVLYTMYLQMFPSDERCNITANLRLPLRKDHR